MSHLWQVLIGVAVALLLAWLALLVALLVPRPSGNVITESLRLMPNPAPAGSQAGPRQNAAAGCSGAPRPAPGLSGLPARLHSRCGAGASLRRRRDRVLWALRSVIRVAGEEPIRRHWPGTSTRCEALLRLTRTNQRAGSPLDVSGGLE